MPCRIRQRSGRTPFSRTWQICRTRQRSENTVRTWHAAALKKKNTIAANKAKMSNEAKKRMARKPSRTCAWSASRQNLRRRTFKKCGDNETTKNANIVRSVKLACEWAPQRVCWKRRCFSNIFLTKRQRLRNCEKPITVKPRKNDTRLSVGRLIFRSRPPIWAKNIMI